MRITTQKNHLAANMRRAALRTAARKLHLIK